MFSREGDLVKFPDGREGWLWHIKTEEEAEDDWEKAGQPDDWESRRGIVKFADGNSETVGLEDFEVVTPKIYVNIYLHDRQYGGPEEGGWWFDVWDVEEVFRCRDEAHAKQVFELKTGEAVEDNKLRRSDVSSVISEGRYEVKLEAWPAERIPAVAPHYE